MSSASIRITVPPARVRDLQKLLALEESGFLPPDAVRFDPDEAVFALELDGDDVSYLLDLLTIAMDTRGAETRSERSARQLGQLTLRLPRDEFLPEFSQA